jgi:hypothetical protein
MKRQQDLSAWLKEDSDGPAPRKEKKGKGKNKKTKTGTQAMASDALLVKRLNRTDLEELFLLARETLPNLMELAKEKLPERLHTQSIAPLEVQTGVKPVFAVGDGIGLLQGIPTNLLCLIFGCRKGSPLQFLDTYRFITSVCRSLRVLTRTEEFFSFVQIQARHIAAAAQVCPGVLGCRELDLYMGDYDPKLCSVALWSQKWTRLTKLLLHGKKLTKGFWSKPMRTWAGWKELEEIEVNPVDNTHACTGVVNALPEVLKQCPKIISMSVPVDCMVACGRALGEARGVGAHSIVRHLVSNSRYATIYSKNWNQIITAFPEMDKFDCEASTFDLLWESAMPAPRILDLKIKIRVEQMQKEQIEEALQTKLTHLAQTFPGVERLSIKFLGNWWRSQRDIRANPRDTGVIDFSLLSMLPLKSLKVAMAIEMSQALYDVKADSLSDMASLQCLEVSGCSVKNEGEILKSTFSVPGMAVKIKPMENNYGMNW